MLRKLATSKWRTHCYVFTWPYTIHCIPTNMVRTRVRGNLRMRKQNTKPTVPLDVVPERRTERFATRFRPVGRFCELRFRYLSSPTGREGEISRPLDHMRQIPFILSARLIDTTNFNIYRTVFQIFSPCGTLRCVLMWSIFNNCARALARTLISRLRPPLELLFVCFFFPRCGDYWCKIAGIYACALLKISNSPFCVIPFHSCLFVSFFLDSKQILFF